MNETEFLRKIFAANTDVPVVDSLSNKVISKIYHGGQLVFSGNTNNIFCVARGTIKSYIVRDDGKEVFNDIFSKDDVFGCLHRLNTNECARVASDFAQVYLVKSSDLLEACDQNFLQDYLSGLENRIIQKESYFLKLMSLGVKERLVFFLETLARKKGQRMENRITIECPLSASEIADSICVTRQSVSLHLDELIKTSWLTQTKDSIELRTLSFERFIKSDSYRQLNAVI